VSSGIRGLGKAPEALKLLISQLVARFPFGMFSLAFVIFIQAETGSFAIAGIALGAETVGASISGPIISRYMSRFGVRKVIGTATFVTSSAIIAMVFVEPEPINLVLLATLVGLSSPPIVSAVRTIYPQVTPKELLRQIYSLDATAQEVIWVFGPLVATLVAAAFNHHAMMLTVAGIQIFGSIWFLANKSVGKAKIPKSQAAVGRVLKNPAVTAVTFLGLLLVGSFAGVEIGSVALYGKALAGLMFAIFSVGSIFGGFVLAPRIKGKYALTIFVSIMLAGYLLLMINPENPYWGAFALFIAGIGVAPSLGILSLWIVNGTNGNDTAEAYGWTTTGQLVGFSAASALAGIAIDTVAAPAAILVSIVFGIATLLAAIYAARNLNLG
jgi:predicted MFS family arabinose efflux permease